MSFQLLTTKLRIPETRDIVVERNRLLNRLDESTISRCRLISVVAPAGFGKTTLLAHSLSTGQYAVAWISLDHNDNDPARFWSYILTATRMVIGEAGDHLMRSLQSPNAPSMLSILTEFINVLSTVEQLVILLDDYHVISNLDIHSDIEFFIDNMPANVTLIVSSRTDPPLPVARLRARGSLAELRVNDLRFTMEEIDTFLKDTMGISLESSQILVLEQKTEGWIAGLQLAALSLRDHSNKDQFLSEFAGSHRYILSYLVDEVLAQQQEKLQSFLLETSILDRLSAALCDAVTQQSESQAILDYLYASNLFIVPLDDYGTWFRYHHLFAEMLQHRLSKLKPSQVSRLHQLASKWYANQAADGNIDYLIPAVNHAIKANDQETASALIEHHRQNIASYGELTTLLGWLNTLPNDLTFRRPRIGILHAWSLLTAGQYQDCTRLLQSIEQNVNGNQSFDSDTVNLINGQVAAIRTTLSGIAGDLEVAKQYAELADALLPSDELIWRGLMLTHLGTAYLLNGNLQIASENYAASQPINQASDNKYEQLVVMWRQARVQRMRGELQLVQQAFENVLKQAVRWDLNHFPPAQYAKVDLGDVLRECNELDQASEILRAGIQNLTRSGGPTVLLEALVFHAHLKLTTHDYDEVLSLIDQAADLVLQKDLPAWCRSTVSALRIEYAVQTGNLNDANRWFSSRKMVVEQKHYFYVNEYLAVARLGRFQEQYELALDLLNWVYHDANQHHRHHHRVKVCLELALIYQAMADHAGAMVWFEKALMDGSAGGYVRTFLDEGLSAVRLLEQVNKASPFHAYAQMLLNIARGADPTVPPSTLSGNHRLVEDLSKREMEVLALLAEGLSDQEIANRLYISVRTVKKHNENIYGKLLVSNRTQAVARARELDLLR